MGVAGIDSHKATLAACAIDEVGQVLGERTFPNERAGFGALLGWLGELGEVTRVGLEGSAGYGAAAARFLLGAGLPAGRGPAAAEPPRAEPNPPGRQERSGRRPGDRPGGAPRGRAAAGPDRRREP